MSTEPSRRERDDKPFVPAISGAVDRVDALLEEGILDEPSHPGVRACFKRFHVLRWIGEGGMGVVLLAHDPQSGRYVAIKLLRPELHTSTKDLERFRREAELLEKITALHHDHIMPVYEIGGADETPYFVMPFIERGSLADRIHREGRLEVAAAVAIAIDIGRALTEAHRRVIYHRDIKPENVLLDLRDRALLADFNLAFDGAVPGSIEFDVSRIAGTAPYLPPEVACCDRQGDARSDIYGLGTLLYTMLSGQPPYTGETSLEIVRQIAGGTQPVPLRQQNRAVSRNLARVIEKAMRREARDRYAEMSLFVRDLESIARGGQPFAGTLNDRRRFGSYIAALACLAAVTAGLGVLLREGWLVRERLAPHNSPSAHLQPQGGVSDEELLVEQQELSESHHTINDTPSPAIERQREEQLPTRLTIPPTVPLAEQVGHVTPPAVEVDVNRPFGNGPAPPKGGDATAFLPAPLTLSNSVPPKETVPDSGLASLRETFAQTNVGQLPNGWNGSSPRVTIHTVGGRNVLAATQTGDYTVTTPRLRVDGDLFFEFSFHLYHQEDNLNITLNGRQNGSNLSVTFARLAPGLYSRSKARVVLNGTESSADFEPWGKHGQFPTIRLDGRGKVFTVRVNGGDAILTKTIPEFEGVESIALELLGNTQTVNPLVSEVGGATAAKLHVRSLQIGPLTAN